MGVVRLGQSGGHRCRSLPPPLRPLLAVARLLLPRLPAHAAKAKAQKVLAGLADLVGLQDGADEFEVLKTVAETLGLAVADDGSTALVEASSSSSSRRLAVVGSPAIPEG